MRWALAILLVADVASAGTPAVAPGTPTVQGTYDVDTVSRIIRRGRGQLSFCYEKELKKTPTLAGTIVIRFMIGDDGQVKSADVTRSVAPDLDACFTGHIRRWAFPRPEKGAVSVQAPFTLSPS